MVLISVLLFSKPAAPAGDEPQLFFFSSD